MCWKGWRFAAAEDETHGCVVSTIRTSSKALIVDGEKKRTGALLSARNISKVKYMDANGVNVYDLLRHEHLVLTKDAVAKVQEVFA